MCDIPLFSFFFFSSVKYDLVWYIIIQVLDWIDLKHDFSSEIATYLSKKQIKNKKPDD